MTLMPSERCCCKVLRYCSNIASPALATEYAGRGGGKALLNARVERDGTTYRVKLEVASPTCIGRVHLTGKVGNSVLLTGKQCTVRARFQREPSRSRKIRAPRAHRVNQTRWPSRYCADCRGQRDGRAAPDASIDAVVSQEAFCHVPDVKKVKLFVFGGQMADWHSQTGSAACYVKKPDRLASQWGTMRSTSPTSDLLTPFKSARGAASGWWPRSSKRVTEERRAVPTLLARADEGIE